MQKSSRRNFIKNTTLATGAGLLVPSILSASFPEDAIKKIRLSKGDVIVFQGDSITDGSRKRESRDANQTTAMGNGYAMIAAAELLFRHAEKELKIYNRGVSGDKVYQLAERWKPDCLDLKPDVLSILVGVNDFWHQLDFNYKGTLKTYRDDLSGLLDRTRQARPAVKLIIGEPFAVPAIKIVKDNWFPQFHEYRAAAREISEKFNAVFIPYQSIFDKAIQKAPGVYWTYDGVHPTLAGSQLMASAWVKCFD